MPNYYDDSNPPRRMWVNQPSTLQPLHHMHGQNVFAVRDYDDVMRIYPVSGPIISLQAPADALALGWREVNPTN